MSQYEWAMLGLTAMSVGMPMIGTCAWTIFALRAHLVECGNRTRQFEQSLQQINTRLQQLEDRISFIFGRLEAGSFRRADLDPNR